MCGQLQRAAAIGAPCEPRRIGGAEQSARRRLPLTALRPQKLRRYFGRQPTLIQIPQQLEPRKLSIAHQPNRHPKRPQKTLGQCHL
jgi:hypothetical protein